METIVCNDLIEFFAAKHMLENRGLFYVRNQFVAESRSKNYIKYDNMFFSLITKQEYDKINGNEN